LGVQSQITDELYGIIDDLADKSRNRSFNKNQIDKENDYIHDQSDKGKVKFSNLTYKEMSSAKKDIGELKEQLKVNPRQYKNQIDKITKVEKKLDNAMIRRKEKDIDKSIHALQKNPRKYAVQTFQTRSRILELRKNLERNPEKYKKQLEKVYHLEKRLDQRLGRMKNDQLNKAITAVYRNPGKYRDELKKFKSIEGKLDKQRTNNKTYDKKNDQQRSNKKYKSKTIEVSISR
jgi:hypothetical protein